MRQTSGYSVLLTLTYGIYLVLVNVAIVLCHKEFDEPVDIQNSNQTNDTADSEGGPSGAGAEGDGAGAKSHHES